MKHVRTVISLRELGGRRRLVNSTCTTLITAIDNAITIRAGLQFARRIVVHSTIWD
jgi:hypothetical protein